jgi:citrate synthase
MLGKILPIASAAFKHTEGKDFVRSNSKLSYCANLINMFFGNSADDPIKNEIAEKAIDILFILHADHEQNCSTSSVRLSGSSGVNPYAAIASGIAALWGPAHGGANEAVINMLEEIGTTDQILKYIDKAKDKNDPFRLMGFGHRVYKNYDPRATIIRKACHDVLASVGQEDSPLLELAQELEKIALKDEYFKSKNLYPNVDFYSGIIYKALNIPATMFTVMFAIARVAGWVSHWKEMVEDPTSRIGRPRQLYTGLFNQEYKDISGR